MDPVRERLAFLLDAVGLEAEHLQATDRRLFGEAFTPQRAAAPELLAQAFSEAHAAVPMLVGFVQACRAYVADRNLL